MSTGSSRGDGTSGSDPQDSGEPESFAVPFVKAIILDPANGRFLLQRRAKPGDAYHGFWELPGGKMRRGETVEAALRREIREEAGLALQRVLGQPTMTETDRFGRTARPITPLATVEVVSGPWPFLGLYFACRADGDPGATAEGDQHRLVSPAEFAAEFLDPEATGACATLDLVALREILGQGRLDALEI